MAQPYDRQRGAYSQLQTERLRADCSYYVPKVLLAPEKTIDEGSGFKISDKIKELFPTTWVDKAVKFGAGAKGSIEGPPLRIGAVLSGGQAPGGHNIIVGIYDQAKRINPSSSVYGFLDGPHGIFTGRYVELDDEIIDGFRNTGGFDMLGSGRHKIESDEQFANSMKTCVALDLDGLVVIGGDDSNTNGAVLAEYFRSQKIKTKVVGAPKTIDGDLKVPPYIPVSFGFDTACRTYAELVGNVAVDSLSAQKYYHFVRLMGRSASNIALEVALQTCANVCLIGEEVAAKKLTLKDLTSQLIEVIEKRHADNGRHYGVILLPEGLIEFIPEFEALIKEINDILAKVEGIAPEDASAHVVSHLSPTNKAAFLYLPDFIRGQLLLDRDPHGNVQVAKIETEKLLAATVMKELEKKYGAKLAHLIFNPQFHAFGYEGRAGLPSFFDSSYCYALGATASSLLAAGETGMIASVKNLAAPISEWECGGVPVTALCVLERRKGKDKPVIEKALVELDGKPFRTWVSIRDKVALLDCYRNPGPLQFSLQCPLSQEIPITLQLELGCEYSYSAVLDKGDAIVPHAVDFPTVGDKFAFFGNRPRSEMQSWRSQTPYAIPDVFADSQPGLAVAKDDTECKMPCDHYVPKLSSCGLVRFQKSTSSSGAVGKLNGPVGIVYCGRQTPGAADVVVGLVECLKKHNPSQEVLGFIGGTAGFFTKKYVSLTPEKLASYRKTGGFELLGRSEDKFDNALAVKQVAKDLNLAGLVLVGGCVTATNACYLSEQLFDETVRIVSVPASMGGELSNPFVEQPLGFDSVTKATARLVGNTAIDGSSARKYWYFLRSMEGPAHTSNVTLEVGLQTKPNHLIIGEQVLREGQSLKEVVSGIADVVENRYTNGKKNFGTVLIPDGLLFSVSELRVLISELDALDFRRLGLCTRTTLTEAELTGEDSSDDSSKNSEKHESSEQDISRAAQQLSAFSRAVFLQLPEYVAVGMLDAKLRGNRSVNLASIETERMLADMVKTELKSRPNYKGSFSPVCQFLGYQSRCTMPSDFDCNYGYALGCTAASLVLSKRTGYMAVLGGLSRPQPAEDASAPRRSLGSKSLHDNCTSWASSPTMMSTQAWQAAGVPLAALLKKEKTDLLPRIAPSPVDLRAPSIQKWKNIQSACASEELYENPGPVQFLGPCAAKSTELLNAPDGSDYFQKIATVKRMLEDIGKECLPGCTAKRMRIASSSLENLKAILEQVVE
ncbi:unnamed protein product [Amoebophrya sp. A25]|nr:unnamed protein product [Amoebophrya sp. A25]|eukprot:GSA25T00010300001.1